MYDALARYLVITLAGSICASSETALCGSGLPDNLRDDRLVAWCIVPFDAKHRGPVERVEMLKRLGIRRVAYDWRAEHVASFEEEIIAYKKHDIEYFAFWGEHESAFRLFEKYDLHPQIWKMLPDPPGDTQSEKVERAAHDLLPLVDRARKMGCKVGIYNHGGWSGEPANMIAVCDYLREHHHADHVGIVYNLHHGHDHVADFAHWLTLLKPYLLCLNLNGMTDQGDRVGKKILPLGEGEYDLKVIREIVKQQYKGPIGIIGHTQDDVELRLRDNLDGLHWLLKQLDGSDPGPRPKLRTYRRPTPSSKVNPHKGDELSVIAAQANAQGNPTRGLLALCKAESGCLVCHKIGAYGGDIGPDLTRIGQQRAAKEIVESILWPQRTVDTKYISHLVLDTEGVLHRGYIVSRSETTLTMRVWENDGLHERKIPLGRIEAERQLGSLMPDNVAATLTRQELLDVVATLASLGTPKEIAPQTRDELLRHALAHQHGPATFPLRRDPIHPESWPSWQSHVNRDRIYDFYYKQAEYFLRRDEPATLLAEFPGLDGGAPYGHWGNQNDDVWEDGRWNETELGNVLCGVFRTKDKTVPRAVCVQLGSDSELAICFDSDTAQYVAAWTGGFLSFSPRRHGFLGGIRPQGRLQTVPPQSSSEDVEYQGLYRVGNQVVFSYRRNGQEWLSVPSSRGGTLQPITAPRDQHPLRSAVEHPPRQTTPTFQTPIQFGTTEPYAVDTIALPFNNPWKALLFCSAHAFLPDGSALICTMQGDVWHVSEFMHPSRQATWRRFATGLHQPLGIVVDGDGIFVQCRDQITRLHDQNNDGVADFYECFSRAFETSPAGHDFICGLERDRAGFFYTASGNQGLLRITPDGNAAQVIATGFRNPDGLGLLPDGTVTVPCSEGEWTPASMICAVPPPFDNAVPHYGYRGPKGDRPPNLPLVYLPRGIDNSAGGQSYVDSDQWGPYTGQLIHFSFGTGSHFLVLRDEVGSQLQGAVAPLPGEFRSGAHRGRFHPIDGQLYVTGMQGWGSYTTDDGCFQRVRYTGGRVQGPIAFHAHSNGIRVTFAEHLDEAIVTKPKSHFVQCWNYRYSAAYGSPEFSARHPGMRGHDVLPIQSAHLLSDKKTLFIELPDLQPVNQLHLHIQTAAGEFQDLFATIHRLDSPFVIGPGYAPQPKTIQPHPLLRDMAMITRSVENPFRKPIPNARAIEIKTGTNLSFQTTTLRVRAGESIALTLRNPDVVPHNWVLAKPGTLAHVGQLADRSISDPDAFLRHYVPQTQDIIAHTDVVPPGDAFTIYFRAPPTPGRYPYLCTFPGHWKVMNGVMVVARTAGNEHK